MPQVYTFKKKVALTGVQSFTFAPTDRIHEYEVCVQWTANTSTEATDGESATVTASAVNTENIEFEATTFKAVDGNTCKIITTLNPKIKVVLAQGLLADGEDAVSTATVYLTATAAYLADDDGLAFDAGTAS